MGCSCGGSDTGSNAGPILTGTLDPAYADTSGAGPSGVPTQQAGLISGFGKLSSGAFWIAVVVVLGIAWYAESQKRKSQ
jgi:hypothetical protein